MEITIKENSQKIGLGHAPGKLILIGEHAVVYGYPAIAMPFKLIGVTSQFKPTQNSAAIDCKYYQGPLDKGPQILKGLTTCIQDTLKLVGKPKERFLIRLKSNIPLGRGLGSSASVAAATIRSIMSFYGYSLPHKSEMDLIQVSETFAHGTPSGIDPEAVTAISPFWFKRGSPVRPIRLLGSLHILVADSGKPANTRQAVSTVRTNLKNHCKWTHKRLEELGRLTPVVQKALEEGDNLLLGQAFNQAHQELASLGVSDLRLNLLIKEVLQAGALGAKLTGGGRGGCIVAIAHDKEHSKRLATMLSEAGAQNVWRFVVGGGDEHDRHRKT